MKTKVNKVSKHFGSVIALNEVSLDLEPGRIYGLVGPNGSGKTTLLLILAGLLAPDAGSVSIGDTALDLDPRQQRAKVGWMPDEFGFWESLTCAEILRAFAGFYGLPRSEVESRVTETLRSIGILDLKDRPAHTLSRGQKQRLGLARALIHDPQLLLLDEPANGLDPTGRLELQDHLRQVADKGTSVVVSSHILTELADLADEPIFLNQGQISTAAAQSRYGTWLLSARDEAGLAAFATARGLTIRNRRRRGRNYTEMSFSSEDEARDFLQGAVEAKLGVTEFFTLLSDLENEFVSRQEGTEK